MHLHVHPPATGPRFMDRREALARLAGAIGGTFASPTLAALLSACERSGGADTTAAALSAEQKELVATVADHIIPRTDTPGAREVGVQDFIAEMMEKHYAPEERQRFLEGLDDLDDRARKANDATFLESTPEQQLAVLTALDRETFRPRPAAPSRPSSAQIRETAEPGTTGSALPPEVAGDSESYKLEQPEPRRSDAPFWRTMKELTLVGYYTSEPGATQELRHEAIPGRYEACVPLSQIGRAWAV
jgi:gluconate 2-dehydrogenase gamma chain